MRKTVINCDVCNEEKTDQEVKTIDIRWTYGYGGKTMDVCIPCLTKFKLIKGDKAEPINDTTPAQLLFELIGEIARNAVSE